MTLRLISSTVGWDKVTGATGYDVKRNGKTVTQTRTALTAKGLTLSSGDLVEVVARPYGQVQATVVTWAEPAGPPPPQAGNGIGLDQLGGSLTGCAHLLDDTYSLIVGTWDDAQLLGQIAKTTKTKTFAYLDGPAWVKDAAGFVAKVKAGVAQFGFSGVFIDEVDPDTAGMLTFIQTVGPQLKAAGILVIANASDFASGDPDSNTGVLWCRWAAQLGQAVSHVMLEYAFQYGYAPIETKLRTTDSFVIEWQAAVAAVRPAVFVGLSYSLTAADLDKLTYCRALMLTAPGVLPTDVLLGGRWDHADPYSLAWCKKNPQPTVNPAAGTATL